MANITLPKFQTDRFTLLPTRPLVYDDGLTILEYLLQLQKWLNETFLGELNGQLAAFQKEVDRLVAVFTELYEGQQEQINNLEQLIIDNAVELQDVVMAALVLDHDSASYDAINELIKFTRPVNLRDFGGLGDGISDDTDALRAFMVYLAKNGGTGTIPAGNYKTTSAVTVTAEKPFNVLGESGANIQVSGNYTGIQVTGNAVSFTGLTFTGTLVYNIPATEMNQYGIRIYNADSIVITDCRFVNFHRAGVWIDGAVEWKIDNNRFDYYGYCAASIYRVGGGSGSFSGNFLQGTRIYPYGFTFCYGVTISHNTESDKPSKAVISGNTIKDQAWEAIDTHGGSEIVFTGNVITNSEVGIVATPVVGIVDSSPQKIIITGNVIDAGDYPTPRQGISLAGAEASGTVLRAAGVIANNIVRGHGARPTSPNYTQFYVGSINVIRVRGVSVADNIIENTYGSAFMVRIADDVHFTGNIINGIRPEAGAIPARRVFTLVDYSEVQGDNNRVVESEDHLAVFKTGGSTGRFHSTSGNYWAKDTYEGVQHTAMLPNPLVDRPGPSYPTGVTWYRIDGSSSTTWPGNGVLEVVNLGGDRCIQLLHSASATAETSIRRRVWVGGSTNAWSEWRVINSVPAV